MWQVLSGDSWASAVARSIFAPDRTDADVAFFFVSYILIAAVMLLNVVVAVLLVITNARGFQIDVGETSNGVLKECCLRSRTSSSALSRFLSPPASA